MSALAAMTAILAALAALALTGVLAAAETSCGLLGSQRIRRLVDAGTRGAAKLDALSGEPARLASAHSVVAGLAFAGIGGLTAWAMMRLLPSTSPWLTVPVTVLLAGALVFSLGEALPRALALANPEDVGLSVSAPAAAITAVAYPIARVLSALWMGLVGLVSREAAPPVPWAESELARAAADTDEARDQEAEDELIEAVEEFSDKIVREVMVPRTDMVCLEDEATVSDAVKLITDHGFSRLPVYHETLDDIRGVVYAKDLLACLGEGSCAVNLTGMVREALFVPETKPAQELLAEMRRRQHIAIVADEYGGTAGLVTIEDLLEELVGEIFDEYDPQTALLSDLGDGTFLVDARLPVDDLNDRFGTAVEPEADTVGGLVAELAGHIPEVGESVEVEGLRLTVKEREGTRVRQIVAEPAPPAADTEVHA
jgi:putative hemolysin